MKTKVFVLVLFWTLWLILPISESNAINLMENRLSIHGFLENQTAIRAQEGVNDEWKLSRFRNTLQVETELKIAEETKIVFIGRGFFDGSWDLQSSLIQSPKDAHTVPDGENMKRDFDAREYYIIGRLGRLVYKIGRQQIAWGESDLFRMADIINPIDYSRRLTFESFENIRIPLRMADFIYEFPGPNEFKIEVVINPEDFRPHAFASPGANWDPVWSAFNYSYKDLGTLPFAEAFWKQMKHDLKNLGKYDLDNFQGGSRLRGKFDGFDISLFYYWSRVQSAVSVLDFTVSPFPMRFKWPRVHTVGGTCNFYEAITKTVFRFESAYTFDQPFTLDHPFIPGLSDSEYAEKDTFAFMIGFDRSTWIRFLNPTKTFFISGQVFSKFIINPHSSSGLNFPIGHRLQTGLGKKGRSNNETTATLGISTDYSIGNQKITPDLTGAYIFKENAGVIIPSIEWRPIPPFIYDVLSNAA